MRSPLLVAVLVACTPKGGAQPPPADHTHDAQCSEPRPSPTHECVQDCGPPVARAEDPPPPWRWLTAAEAASRRQYGCAICLPQDTRIATPGGEVPVTALRVGDPIWTLDADGRRVEGHVRATGSTPVVGGHAMTRVTLHDGRVVTASPGHPTADGVSLWAVQRGGALSGARVVDVARVPYAGARTHDVLPSGPTGAYWADGVLLRSSFVDAAAQ
ncbi:MAG: Hint domain-containing protein [Nannocystaceae bacterium]|nr:Hint domain-containing protein [Nannocystaceae bacterium]